MKRILCICCFFTDSNTDKANIGLIAVAQHNDRKEKKLMSVHNKLYHLIQVREYLNSTQYREANLLLSLLKDLAENIQERDLKVKRTAVLDRTNLQLRSMKPPSVSYVIRKFL
jgi:hypothetical protein